MNMRVLWLEAIESLTAMSFIFVPGHAGVIGKERVDKLTDLAVEQWTLLTFLMSAGTTTECQKQQIILNLQL
jgi:hypothetical protein